jgi:Flp pilus assembly protein TadB
LPSREQLLNLDTPSVPSWLDRPRMASDDRERRAGLEGLPVNPTEVWGFNAVRAGRGRPRDTIALIFCWLVTALLGAGAIWGHSVVLGVFAVILLVIVVWWTYTKVRDRNFIRRVQHDN